MEAGDTYDCDFCDGTHEVRSGSGLAVKGFEPRVGEAVYARCPETGLVDLSGTPTPVGTGGEEGDDVEDGASGDWP